MADRRARLTFHAARIATAIAVCAAVACTPEAAEEAIDATPAARAQPPAPAESFAPGPPRPWVRATLEPERDPKLDTGPRCTVSAALVPACGAWWGVAPAAFTETPRTRALHDFERKIGRTVDIYHAFHRGEQIFPTEEEMAIAREPGRRRMLLLNWKPDWGHSWAAVAAGAMDGHIDRLAGHVNAHFPERFFLVIHHEPEEEVRPEAGSGYTAGDFRNMFRHVVHRFRAKGVDNALFTAVFMGTPKWGVKPWFDRLYPGDDVVDWLGMDPYATPDIRDFAQLVNQRSALERGFPGFYDWSAEIARDKPLMIAEWGTTTPGARQAAFFRSVSAQLARYPRIKALVYFETPKAPFAGGTIDTRIDAGRAALGAYRTLGHRPMLNQ
jgi:hypothetical protein